MKFNQYLWSLYKDSPGWERMKKYFSDANGYAMFRDYCPHSVFMSEEVYSDLVENIYCYGVSDYDCPRSLEEASDLYDSLISLGIRVEGELLIPYNSYKTVLELIQPISCALFKYAPEYFVPYLFICRMFELNEIADTFGIQLPPLPSKYDYKSRCLYYWSFCELMYQFRKINGLSSEELFAFLYDYAPNFIEREESGIPKPSRAWFIGGKLYPEDKVLKSKFWQSSSDTKKGDILVHYETSPISAITCIEISQTDGIIDPLFYYYSNIYIGNRIDIPHITLDELKSDSYFREHSLVRKNFHGVNGCPMSGKDYLEIMRILTSKGFDTSVLPKIYVPLLPEGITLEKERDVEMNLLEPLLNSMGWYENKDFIRQLPIHAGRGHRIFPDYALHYDNKPEEEKAKVLIEAKFYMKNNQEMVSTFLQAFSYAKLLESSVIVLCDRECLLVYESKNGFSRNRYKKYHWEDMNNPDLYNELKDKLNI